MCGVHVYTEFVSVRVEGVHGGRVFVWGVFVVHVRAVCVRCARVFVWD